MLFIEYYNSLLNTSISSNNDLPFPVKIHFKKLKKALQTYVLYDLTI